MLDPSAPGQIGRYTINECIGRGGMGTVYRAYDPQICRTVAIKVLHSHDEQFLHEVRAVGGLKHRNIVTIYDCAREDGQSIIVMEHIDGRTLFDLIRKPENLPTPVRLRLIAHLCSALRYAHDRKIVHRDIKPANLMVDRDGQLKVLDFGVARMGEATQRDEGVVGTYKYMAPEQALGGRVDQRSDIFAVGVVMYELLSSRHPFPGNTLPELMKNLQRAQPAPLTDLCPDLHPGYWGIVSRALQKEPANRYQTLVPMIADLARIANAPVSRPRFTVGPDRVVIDRGDAEPTRLSRGRPAEGPRPADENAPAARVSTAPSSHAQPLLSPLVWLAIVVPLVASIAVVAVVMRRPTDPLSVNRTLTPARQFPSGTRQLPAEQPSRERAPYAQALALLTSSAGSPNLERAFRLFDQACGSGDVRGCRQAAQMLESGRGVTKNAARAAAFYDRGCDSRDSGSCQRLALMYRDGVGIPANLPRAIASFTKACDLDAPDSCSEAGVGYLRGVAVPKDETKAVSFFTRACDKKSALGCENLARSYWNGRGVQRDQGRAATLFQKACDAGAATACGELAYVLTQGVDGVKDEARAIALFNRACNARVGVACVNLGVAYARGTLVARDEAKAAGLYQRGCDAGEARGCASLATMYGEGRGVVKDNGRANALWRRACDGKVADACQVLAQRQERGLGQESASSKVSDRTDALSR